MDLFNDLRLLLHAYRRATAEEAGIKHITLPDIYVVAQKFLFQLRLFFSEFAKII